MSPCDGGGSRLLPENASYREGSGTPYRIYRVALPSNAKPSVSVADVSTRRLSDWCAADTLKNGSVEISSPKLYDGVWVTDISVPLIRVSGGSVTVREKFRLTVSFAGKASNQRPGKRLLSSVVNPKGASSFGVSSRTARALRKLAGDVSNVNWLARILVGDKDNGGTAEDGLYAVTYRDVLSLCREAARSSDCEGIPVDQLRLFGAPQDTLPDVIGSSAEILPNRLFEIPIEVRDHGPRSSAADGTFNEGDTIFFAGYGTSMWKRIDLEDKNVSGSGMEYYYSTSPYSFYQYFQLGWSSSGKGLRISNVTSPTSGKEIEILRYVRTERDALLRDTYFGNGGGWEESTGKEWFWFWNSPDDTLSISSSSLFSSRNSTLPHMTSGAKYLSVSYVPHRSTATSTMSDGTQQTANSTLSNQNYATRMADHSFLFTVNGQDFSEYGRLLPGGNFEIVDVPLKPSGNTYALKMLPNGKYFDRFDGFTIAYAWNPAIENDTAEWILPGKQSGRIKFSVTLASDAKILKFENFEPVGFLATKDGYAYDSLSADIDTRYLLYRESSFRKPASLEAVPVHIDGVLENIARISSKTEYLIIAPEAFMTPAVELAKFRSEGKAVATFKTTVVLVEDIYRAYTGGAADPVAIRNYLAYARSVSPDLRYALLAGNGHFDYRGIQSDYKTNWLPPFEKEDAVSEDFFAVLDSGERVLRGSSYDLDLNVGRLPLGSVADFNAYNAKVEEYERTSSADRSSWRNSLIMSADDAWTGTSADYIDHTGTAENIARLLLSESEAKDFHIDVRKIYLLDYKSDASGQKPEAATDLINRINQGALFTIYFGHGSISDWAFEGLMKPSYIASLSNKSLYTILGSFSCTVGRFDKGNETSLSEQFLQASGKGAIASIGATRETYSSLSQVFAKSLLVNAVIEGNTLGEAYRQAKAASNSTSFSQRYNNERYVLLGEPVISMPSGGLSVDLEQKIDTIRALDSMKLSGTVSGISDGKVQVSIFEQSYEKNLSREPALDEEIAVLYDGSQIFSEEAEVKNGKFELSFITPRKISFGDTAAEIRLWAYGSSTPEIGRTVKSKIAISGTSAYADSIIASDSLPPTIEIQSCLSPASGTSFSEGETVTLASPACLQVTVSDSTAIDFREQADEGISFEVVGTEASADPFHPWPYLEQSSKRAVARMTFGESKYPAGLYTFKVRATDIIGNSALKTVKVNITDGLSEGLADVFTAPNPMKRKGTTFYFKNLAVGRTSDVTIFIYNQNGRLVQRITNAESGKTTWDGRDFYGRKLANGLYHYIVVSKVRAEDGAKAKTFRKKQKLVISR